MSNPRIPPWPGYWIWPANPPNLLTTTLGGQVQPPFSLTNWPNPIAPVQPQENRGFVHGVNVLLIGQDRFFAAPGEAPVYSWPNPLQPQRLPQADCQSSLLVGSLAVPFHQLDWPNPPRLGPQAQPDLPHSFLTSVVIVATPFALKDWPNPPIPIQPQENRGFTRNSNVQLIGQDQFFGARGQAPVYDWPPPQVPRRPAQADCQSSLLVGVLAVPFQQLDWPNPLRPRLAAQPDAPPNLLTTVAFVTAAPFSLMYWPNPIVPVHPQENRGFVHGVNVELAGKDKFFAAPGQGPNYDWPNPQIPRQPQENRGFIGQPLVRFIGQDTFFGAPGEVPTYDWPLPQVPRQPIQPEPPPNFVALQPAVFVMPEYVWTEATRNIIWIEANRPVIWPGGNY